MSQELLSDACRLFFDNAPTPLWLQHGRTVVDANALALKLFRVDSLECFSGRDICSFIVFDGTDADDDLDGVLAIFRAVEAGEVASEEWRCRSAEGGIIDLHVDLKRLVVDGEVFIQVASRDITNFKEMMQGYRSAIQQNEEFIATFSHELRTSLFSILGFSNILRKDTTDFEVEQVKEFLSILNIETLKISSLIDDVLSLSRIKHEGKALNTRSADIGGLLEALVGALAASARQKGIILRLSQEGEDLRACVEPDSVKRAFVNIVDNALKYTPSGGSIEISISVDKHNSLLRVEVRDTGFGIPAADLPRIFEKFYRVRRPGIVEDGYGLGLAIARKIIENNSGSIAVESVEGRGSLFRIQLPLFDVSGNATYPG